MLTSQAEVLDPRTLREALELLAERPGTTLMAGATDLMVNLEAGQIDPPTLINLWGISELAGVESSGDGLWIGALTTYTQIIGRRVIEQFLPTLFEAAQTIGARQIQNRGTLGGNIANASPAGDMLPVLLSLDAHIEVSSLERGRRLVPADMMWLAYRTTALKADELITRVWVPLPDQADKMHFRKIGTRQAQAISKVVLAARLRIESGLVSEARVALGSVMPTPVRAPSVERALIGKPVDVNAANQLDRDIHPIDDVRSTATYRLMVARRTLRSFLECFTA